MSPGRQTAKRTPAATITDLLPQPTFVSTQKYYCHVDNSCYMNFDFSAPEYHELALWEDKTTLRFECADTYIALLEKLTALLGRQPELPDWVYDGVTLGIQGGTEVCQQNWIPCATQA